MPKIVDHDDRRREIIEACWKVLADRGVEGLTIRNIAAATGCATGRITHYFANRETLVNAAMDASYADLKIRTDAILAQEHAATQKLLQISEEILPLDDRRLQAARVWLAFWNIATIDEALANENDDRHHGWRRDLAPLMAEVNGNLDAEFEARLLIAAVNGLNAEVAVHPTATNKKHARRVLRTHIEALAEK
jgi:AcrR family transcriptional regulator